MPRASRQPIGFVILSHANPHQVLRLVTTLNKMYGDPPIAWHHDFSQSSFETSKVPSNVLMVKPSIKTGWGKWSVVQSFLAALDLLYNQSNPDWFCLLSGADYPAARAEVVLDELSSAKCDAFLDVHHSDPVQPLAQLIGSWNPALSHLETEGQYRQKDQFYNKAQLWIPLIRMRPKLRLGRLTYPLPFRGPRPYGRDVGLFWGDHWFTANRDVARTLLNPTEDHGKVQRHLKRRAFPEESYYQTVLSNTPGLIICRDNKRFAEWDGGGAHPRTLTEAEVPSILASGAHFARKFAPNSQALDALDEALFP